MNKRTVDQMMPKAYRALDKIGIVKEGNDGQKTIDKKYRGQMSSFGAAVQGGSLISAVAFFSEKGSADVDRQKLMDAIYMVIKGQEEKPKEEKALFHYVMNQMEPRINAEKCREQVLNAAIALKLAINAYPFEKEKKEG